MLKFLGMFVHKRQNWPPQKGDVCWDNFPHLYATTLCTKAPIWKLDDNKGTRGHDKFLC